VAVSQIEKHGQGKLDECRPICPWRPVAKAARTEGVNPLRRACSQAMEMPQ
jgi:hypothetical protein